MLQCPFYRSENWKLVTCRADYKTPDLHHHTIHGFPSRNSTWIDFNLERSNLWSNIEFLYKSAWEYVNVAEILSFPVKMEKSEAWIILTSKNDDRINNCCVEFIITSNLSRFPWFHKHCILSLGQMPTDIFEDSILSSEYSAIWRKKIACSKFLTLVNVFKS